MLIKKLSKLIFGSLFFSQTVWGGDLLNVGLRVDMKYESFGESCHLRSLFRHYDLSLEVINSHVNRGQLTKLGHFGPTEHTRLNDHETASFDIRSEAGLSWIKAFSASPSLMRKLMNTSTGLGKSDFCLPPQDLIFDDLGDTVFDFGVEAVNYLLPHLIHSQPVILRGHKPNGDPFRIQITLTQDRI